MTEHNYCRLVRWIGRLLHTERYFLIQELIVVGLGVVGIAIKLGVFVFISYGAFIVGLMSLFVLVWITSRFLSFSDAADRRSQIQNINTTATLYFELGIFLMILLPRTLKRPYKDISYLYTWDSWRFWRWEFFIFIFEILGLFWPGIVIICLFLIESAPFVGTITGVPILLGIASGYLFYIPAFVFFFSRSSKHVLFIQFSNTLLFYLLMMIAAH